MLLYTKALYCIIIVFDMQIVWALYNNDTMHTAKLTNDDLISFHKFGKRSGGRDGRRLISFDTRNDNIEVGLEFSVPFITIPVKRSVDTMKSWASTTTSFVTDPIANINTGAVALTGAVVLGGVATTYLWKMFIKDQVAFANRPHIYPTYGRRHNHLDEIDHDDPVTKVIEKLEKVLHKYDIDTAACTQRTICMSVRSAAENVAKGSGSSMEKILDGIANLPWIRRVTSGTAVSDAISAGQHQHDCEKKYSGCKLKWKSFEHVLDLMMRSLS